MVDRVERQALLEAPPAEVWNALTEPGRLAGWLAERAEIDLRPGGELWLRLLDGTERRGFVEAADAPARLVLWWREAAAEGEDAEGAELTRVEIILLEAEEGTLLRVIESRPLAALGAGGPLALAGASGRTLAAARR
jgi:uncharacterized protein YndB with AHSA1/START domain